MILAAALAAVAAGMRDGPGTILSLAALGALALAGVVFSDRLRAFALGLLFGSLATAAVLALSLR
ncbi:MAG TPA: hypothetical protein VGB83_06605 [Actinomycetota bacterium]